MCIYNVTVLAYLKFHITKRRTKKSNYVKLADAPEHPSVHEPTAPASRYALPVIFAVHHANHLVGKRLCIACDHSRSRKHIASHFLRYSTSQLRPSTCNEEVPSISMVTCVPVAVATVANQPCALKNVCRKIRGGSPKRSTRG